MTEHLAYFSLKNFLGSVSLLCTLSTLRVEEIEAEFVEGGIGGVLVVGEGECPLVVAFKFCVLFVLARPNPWRLEDVNVLFSVQSLVK